MWRAKASVFAFLTFNIIVGCELETICDPQLDENTFATLLGPEVRSIVRKQPTISELIDKALKDASTGMRTSQRRQSGGIFEVWCCVLL
jgi:hypothetical protein